MFYFENIQGKQVLKSDLLDGVNHFFTTRDCIDFTQMDVKTIISPEQTHSDNVKIVSCSENYSNTDALIIKDRNIGIKLKFADCTPIIFYDRLAKIGAITHAGWRGTANKIGVKTVLKMCNELSSSVENIIAVIGPAISICCYEVSKEVKTELLKTVKNSQNLYSGNNVSLKDINARQLEEIGVKNIDICPYCTSCNNDKFYSYRKEDGTTNRHYAYLNL